MVRQDQVLTDEVAALVEESRALDGLFPENDGGVRTGVHLLLSGCGVGLDVMRGWMKRRGGGREHGAEVRATDRDLAPGALRRVSARRKRVDSDNIGRRSDEM